MTTKSVLKEAQDLIFCIAGSCLILVFYFFFSFKENFSTIDFKEDED